MTTKAQNSYITDLAVIKTKEFKEVKELLVSSGIVGADAATVADAPTINAITAALTDEQASNFITLLDGSKTPDRSRVYSQKRVGKTIDALAGIKKTIDGWNFE